MEKLIEDLLLRLEIEKMQSLKTIEVSTVSNDKSLEFIHSGKIFAFDFCIGELKRILAYNLESKSKSNK